MNSAGGSWWERVRVEALSAESRRLIVWRVKEKLGFNAACEVLGIVKSSMHRYLSGERVPPDDVVRRALQFLEKEEFEGLVSGYEKLKALGVVRENGVVDYDLALSILALASRDEYLKNAVLNFIVREFRDDLRRMLGISFAGVTLR